MVMNETQMIERVMREYVARKKPVHVLAHENGITPATLTGWAKKFGVPLRGRGRWRRANPSPQHARMIQLVRTQTYKAVGRRFGLTRQRVHQIIKRWNTPDASAQP